MKKSPQQWVETLEQQKNSTLTIKEFCQLKNISTSGFYKHKKLVTSKGRFSLVKTSPAIQESALEAINDSNACQY